MPMPTRVQIGPCRFAVLHEHLDGMVGECDNDAQRIRICTDQGRDQYAASLLHEVIHAVWHQVGLEQEERYVRAMTPMLLDTLRRNPDLVAYLTEGDA